MEISEETKLETLLKEYPFLVDYLADLAPEYRKLRSRVLRKTMGKVATLGKIASMGQKEVQGLLKDIAEEVKARTNEVVTIKIEVAEKAPEKPSGEEERQQVLKEIIKGVHEGEDMEVLKKKFRDLISDVDPSEISQMEQKLIDEGMPETEVKRLCDVHVQIFKESLDKKEIPTAPPGHPVHTFMLENREAEKIIGEMEGVLEVIGEPPDDKVFFGKKEDLAGLLERLSQIELHYQRKENQLFPLLEAHDVSGPSQVMWGIHDDVRAMLKKAKEELSEEQAVEFVGTTKEMLKAISEMIYKEEHILFPMSLEQLADSEWEKVRAGENEIGYAWVEPESEWPGEVQVEAAPEVEEIPLVEETPVEPKEAVQKAKLALKTGYLSKEQIDLMLTNLPFDLTFVDENDRVAYYSAGKERLFPRSPGIIGRQVQKCHPPRSVHIVEKIVGEFKAGTKDVADFWLQMDDRIIYIRYFPVRDPEGNYKGTMEVSQDITEIKKIEGEKRLLDWE